MLELERLGMLDLSTNAVTIKRYDLQYENAEKVIPLFKKAAKKIHAVDMSNLIEGGVVSEEAYKSLHSICSVLRHCDIIEVRLDENLLGERGVEACSDILQCMRIEVQFFVFGLFVSSSDHLLLLHIEAIHESQWYHNIRSFIGVRATS